MKTSLDCIPCFIRQALEAARFITDDPAIHEQAVREVLAMAATLDLVECPPMVGQRIHRRLREITGIRDPYKPVKESFNQMALAMLPELEETLAQSPDPFYTATRLAIAGNVIDHGVRGSITEEEVKRSIREVLSEPFIGDRELFRRQIEQARDILYLADNAGEIVFDRLLIEQIMTTAKQSPITLAVRGHPVINDVTLEDAELTGLSELVEVIDNGSDAPGTLLNDCSEAFQRRFQQADVVIAKGQGNYETLSDVDRPMVFLFKVKCPVIARGAGLPCGTHALLCSEPAGLGSRTGTTTGEPVTEP